MQVYCGFHKDGACLTGNLNRVGALEGRHPSAHVVVATGTVEADFAVEPTEHLHGEQAQMVGNNTNKLLGRSFPFSQFKPASEAVHLLARSSAVMLICWK